MQTTRLNSFRPSPGMLLQTSDRTRVYLNDWAEDGHNADLDVFFVIEGKSIVFVLKRDDSTKETKILTMQGRGWVEDENASFDVL